MIVKVEEVGDKEGRMNRGGIRVTATELGGDVKEIQRFWKLNKHRIQRG